ncbi:MAG TPA: MMPL family transporter, partial [Solirubrobacter sp.]|nr:MMPL family transporter [Solirubrobacter sp.]
AANENEAFLSRSAESTVVNDLIDDRFTLGREVTAIVAYTHAGGLTEADQAQIQAEAHSLCDSHAIPDLKTVVTPYGLACGELDGSLAPETPPSQVSGDGDTGLVTVSTTDEDTRAVVRDVATLRRLVPDPGPGRLGAYVTGEAGFTADASEAYEGIDETLLAITVALVLVLLLATYRSPLLAFAALAVVGIAYLVAAAAVYALVAAGALQVTGQATAILIVLMFGAGTDYCLLLVSRYREELRQTDDARAALTRATRRSAPAILSAGATVVVAMLVLGLADYRATRSMGPVLALGIAVMVLAGLTLLPAVLALAGRRAFWPAGPGAGSERAGGVWDRIGRAVSTRPALTAGIVLALLVAGALGNLPGRGTLAFTDNLRSEPESVGGLELIKREFGPGRTGPVDLIVETSRSPDVLAAFDKAPEVAAVTPVSYSRGGKLMLVELTLAADPFSEQARDAVPRLRAVARGAADGGTALVGGVTAEAYDSARAQRSDAAVIVPLTLLLILLIVAVLVRAVVAPLYLVGTVVLSYAFALGASALIFTHVFGQPDSDPALPLFAFIFLVALGADYNIFLISRIREEHRRLDARDAVVAGLRRTGGVITSAGLILAGTFGALMAIPVEGLLQAGFTISLGLLVDAFAIRIFLVPAIAVLLGEASWWPARLSRRRRRVRA